jgi:hypothetical protein
MESWAGHEFHSSSYDFYGPASTGAFNLGGGGALLHWFNFFGMKSRRYGLILAG